ncbi:hypothetical protein SLS55_003756 [Diplodia seriata]|uniref:Saponin hydrolase n=1 Tax=Diplodia seriata TaxID=420778 RepID=A0ABR3CNU5_9PEZI
MHPEPISVTELPLPPVTPSTDEASCTPDINPRRTGCIGKTTGLQSGSFLPDGNHVTATVTFVGAPAAPDSASIYNGSQIILVKADGSTFPNGDAWKCITCGVPEENTVGRSDTTDYPQTFRDGKRMLAGSNIIDCGDNHLNSTDCTPDKVHIYPIRWNVKADGSGASGLIRELRLHPDDAHLGFNSFSQTASGKLDQQTYFARLAFNPAPTTGTPLAPRYDLTNVTLLFNPNGPQPLTSNGTHLALDPAAITVGELRGFSGTGAEITYIGYPRESCNIDAFAVSLATGAIRRLTSHPEYTDPVAISPDDAWTVAMDTRGSGRQMFMAGMRHVPPLVDAVVASAAASTRNNGARRFFQPYLIDAHGDRGDYFGQQINAAGNGTDGAVNDPQWNGRADPRWAPDGTRIAYWQALAVAPACGGTNPEPCRDSTEPGGRTARLMLARLTAREARPRPEVVEASDVVPWGTPYVPGERPPAREYPGAGTYTLVGKAAGEAEVVLGENADGTALANVVVTYRGFSDDGLTFLDGRENVTTANPSPTLEVVDWYSDLVQTGKTNATKKTSPDGFHLRIDVMTNIFEANGTLTTTVDGKEWKQPANGT